MGYTPMPEDELRDMLEHHRRKRQTHWCCRRINFQRWFIVAALAGLFLLGLGFYVYMQAVDWEIHFVSGSAEMRENQRIGALERGAKDVEGRMETLERTVTMLRDVVREVHPNYIWQKEE